MPTTVVCESCGDRFEARHATARFCSDRCRQRAHRGAQQAAEGPSEPGPVEVAVRAELAGYGAAGSSRGEVAVSLARALDRAKVGHAGIAKELLRLMATIRVSQPRY